jgi:hypothetical protein
MPDLRCCACGETFDDRADAKHHFMSEPPSHFFEETHD